MKNTNTWKDIAETTTDIEAGKYFINEEGNVRTASKKPKKQIQDCRGRQMVVLATKDGQDTAYYITDILTSAFGAPDADNFNENALAAAKKGSSTRTRKSWIQNITTGTTYRTVAEAARAAGVGYDKFYNMFYTGKTNTVVYNGNEYKLCRQETKTETAEESIA